MLSDPAPFSETFFERSLVGYSLSVVASVREFPVAPEHWKVVDERAELEIIVTDRIVAHVLDPKADTEREYEAIIADGSRIKAWDIVRVMRLGDGFDFHGFRLPPTSEARSTEICVTGKVPPTPLKYWQRELENFEPAKYYVFYKKEKEHREQLLERIDSPKEQLYEARIKSEERKIRDDIQSIKRELYGKWADYDVERALTEMKSAIMEECRKQLSEKGHIEKFEIDAESFEVIETVDSWIDEGTVTVAVDMSKAKDGELMLTVEYYNGDSTMDYIMFSHSETVNCKTFNLVQHPEIRMVINGAKRESDG